MVELIVGALAGAGLLAAFGLGGERGGRPGRVRIATLGSLAGATVTVVGRVRARPTTSPVSWHPAAAWWCWFERLEPSGRALALGAAAGGAFAVDDGSGRLELDAGQCRMAGGAGAEARLRPGDWPPPGGSAFHDALRQVARAAGLDRPELSVLRVRERLLPLGAELSVTGLVVVADPAEAGGGYRGGGAGAGTLGPTAGGWIELAPR